ncbi:MAG: hypothetical protein JXA74_00905, partial [Anaerolineae bacterium]|nr:hypothetical protein [Anaerolineae bacterium]
MQYSTTALSDTIVRALPSRLHLCATLCLLCVMVLAYPFEASAGWMIWPPAAYAEATAARRGQEGRAVRVPDCRWSV